MVHRLEFSQVFCSHVPCVSIMRNRIPASQSRLGHRLRAIPQDERCDPRQDIPISRDSIQYNSRQPLYRSHSRLPLRSRRRRHKLVHRRLCSAASRRFTLLHDHPRNSHHPPTRLLLPTTALHKPLNINLAPPFLLGPLIPIGIPRRIVHDDRRGIVRVIVDEADAFHVGWNGEARDAFG